MIYGFIIIGICLTMIGIVIGGCIGYRKAIKEDLLIEKMLAEKNAEVKEISLEELSKFLMSLEPEDNRPLHEQVYQWIQDKDAVPLSVTNDPYVEVVDKCVGNSCACSPAREDCCRGDYDHGICKFYININKLCGIDEISKRDPKYITPAEAEMLSRALTEYYKTQDLGK